MNDKERMKNDHEIDHGNITEALQKLLGFDFSSFSFFSLISVKSPYKWCWIPSPQPLTPIYRKIRGGGCTTAHPGELIASPLSLLVGPGAGKCPKNAHFAPFFWTFCIFHSEMSQNPTNCATISVKQLNSADKSSNVSQRSSPDKIRVWQLPLFTYLLLEIKGK